MGRTNVVADHGTCEQETKMTIKVKNRIPQIDVGKTRNKWNKEMTAYTIEVLKQWVINTTDVIPVWSGGSKASFIKAADTARLTLDIQPVAPTPPGSRIGLGIQESEFIFMMEIGGKYGWDWESSLFYIDIVEDRVQFIQAGDRAIRGLAPPQLSQPVFKRN